MNIFTISEVASSIYLLPAKLLAYAGGSRDKSPLAIPMQKQVHIDKGQ